MNRGKHDTTMKRKLARAELETYVKRVRTQVEGQLALSQVQHWLQVANLARRAYRVTKTLNGRAMVETLGRAGATWGRDVFTDDQVETILRACLTAAGYGLSEEEGVILGRALRDRSEALAKLPQPEKPSARKAGRLRKVPRRSHEELISRICEPSALETFGFEPAVEAAAKALVGLPDVSKRLIAERLVSRVSIAELARRAGLQEATVERMLAGVRRKIERYTSYFSGDHWWTDDEAALA